MAEKSNVVDLTFHRERRSVQRDEELKVGVLLRMEDEGAMNQAERWLIDYSVEVQTLKDPSVSAVYGVFQKNYKYPPGINQKGLIDSLMQEIHYNQAFFSDSIGSDTVISEEALRTDLVRLAKAQQIGIMFMKSAFLSRFKKEHLKLESDFAALEDLPESFRISIARDILIDELSDLDLRNEQEPIVDYGRPLLSYVNPNPVLKVTGHQSPGLELIK